MPFQIHHTNAHLYEVVVSSVETILYSFGGKKEMFSWGLVGKCFVGLNLEASGWVCLGANILYERFQKINLTGCHPRWQRRMTGQPEEERSQPKSIILTDSVF